MKKHNAWAVQFKTDGEWLTQTWHKREAYALAEMENERWYFGDFPQYRVIPTYFKWR
jgi:hypothetical protein